MNSTRRHLGIGAAAILTLAGTWELAGIAAADPAEASKPASPQNDVVELDGVAVQWGAYLRKEKKIELHDEALDKVVVLATKDGRTLPILPTEAGLFFYRDERVQGRPMRVRARLVGGTALEVIDRHTLVDGKANEIYYWCEICSIQMYHLKQCDCCQGPIELREHPVGEAFRLKGDRPPSPGAK